MKTLTLLEFTDGCIAMSTSMACDYLGMFPEDFGENVKHIWVSYGSFFVEELDGTFDCHVGRDEFTGSKSDTIAFLYFEHHTSECCSGWTLETLTTLLADFTTHYDLPKMSADELLADAEDHKQREFLEWFIERWEEVA
jgi:hypothetical protein